MAIYLHARELRKNGTIGEKHLWKKLLSRRQLKGYKFHRQKVIGTYIYDFYCYELQLVIEIDGSSHYASGIKDKSKEDFAKKCGLELIRFTEYDARFKLEEINLKMLHFVEVLEQRVDGERGGC